MSCCGKRVKRAATRSPAARRAVASAQSKPAPGLQTQPMPVKAPEVPVEVHPTEVHEQSWGVKTQ